MHDEVTRDFPGDRAVLLLRHDPECGLRKSRRDAAAVAQRGEMQVAHRLDKDAGSIGDIPRGRRLALARRLPRHEAFDLGITFLRRACDPELGQGSEHLAADPADSVILEAHAAAPLRDQDPGMVLEHEPGDAKGWAEKAHPLDRHVPLDKGQDIRGDRGRRNPRVLPDLLLEKPVECRNAEVAGIRVAGEDDAGAQACHMGLELIVASRENFVAFRQRHGPHLTTSNNQSRQPW